MSNTKVTVLMAVYNDERHIKEAVDSILNQTFNDFEFLIINDASKDGTYEILKSYNDPRIKIHTNDKNIGLSKSLNIGLKIAKGEYVARQDSDDISMPERLKKQVAFLNTYPDYAVVGTFAKVLNDDSEEVQLWERPIEDSSIREYLKTDNCIVHGSAMIRMPSLINVGFYDESMEKSQDYELWLRFSKKYKMANIPEFLYLWRTNREKVGIKYIKEKQILVALAKIKNDFVGPKETSIQLINSFSKLHFTTSVFYYIFKLIRWITLKRINAYNIYKVFFKVKFSNKIKKTLDDFKSGRISFDDAKSDLKKILNVRFLGLFL